MQFARDVISRALYIAFETVDGEERHGFELCIGPFDEQGFRTQYMVLPYAYRKVRGCVWL